MSHSRRHCAALLRASARGSHSRRPSRDNHRPQMLLVLVVMTTTTTTRPDHDHQRRPSGRKKFDQLPLSWTVRPSGRAVCSTCISAAGWVVDHPPPPLCSAFHETFSATIPFFLFLSLPTDPSSQPDGPPAKECAGQPTTAIIRPVRAGECLSANPVLATSKRGGCGSSNE